MSACSAPVLVASRGTPTSNRSLSSTRSTVENPTNMLDNVEGKVRLEVDEAAAAEAVFGNGSGCLGQGGHGVEAGGNGGSLPKPERPTNRPR